jgi:hypothetical protein
MANPLGGFGVLGVGALPVYGRSVHEDFIDALKDVRAFFAGIATRVPLSKQWRPRYLFQFKNGTTAPFTNRDVIELVDIRFFESWDRSLGQRVLYTP